MEGRDKLECAGRALAGALAQRDIRKAAALLRCAAKYLEGAADVGDWTDAGLSARGLVGCDARAVR